VSLSLFALANILVSASSHASDTNTHSGPTAVSGPLKWQWR